MATKTINKKDNPRKKSSKLDKSLILPTVRVKNR